MTTFAVTLHLSVEGPNDVRRGHFERLTDRYAALEMADPRLLDCSWSYAERGGHAEVDVDLTVEAEDKATAFAVASAAAWSAIQQTGGSTPGWGERAPGSSTVMYRVTDEKVKLVVA